MAEQPVTSTSSTCACTGGTFRRSTTLTFKLNDYLEYVPVTTSCTSASTITTVGNEGLMAFFASLVRFLFLSFLVLERATVDSVIGSTEMA